VRRQSLYRRLSPVEREDHVAASSRSAIGSPILPRPLQPTIVIQVLLIERLRQAPRAQRKPQCPLELSGVERDRADTRYRAQ
jgi:hypothetical protein